MSLDILKKLAEPFPPDCVEWRVAQAGKTAKGPWAKVLAYITARAIMDRLDQVMGPENWKVGYRFIGKDQAGEAGVVCELSLKMAGEWVTKEDGADQTDIEAFKGGISSALKRAAVLWSVGRYLYSLEEGWAQIVERGTPGAHWNSSKTREGEKIDFHWLPPQLPDWALPSRQLKEPPKQEAPKAPDPKPLGVTPKAAPKPNSSEQSGRATQSRSPFAGLKKSEDDKKRDELSRRVIDLYRPFLEKFPNTNFAQALIDRYNVIETAAMTTVQLSDLVTWMQEGVGEKPKITNKPGKSPTDSERMDLWNASKTNGWTAEQMTEYLKLAFGVDSSKQLTRDQFQLLQDISPKVKFDLAISEFKYLKDVP